jgi:uncharacterized membrane protein YhaH (DUF805 family)
MGRLFFSFRGRISRAEFWVYVFLCVAVSTIFLIVIGALRKGFHDRPSDLMAWTLTALQVLSLYSSLAVAAKRLHDRDKSAWPRLLAMYVGPWLIFIAALYPYMGESGMETLRNSNSPPASILGGLLLTFAAFFAVFIYGFTALGCRRGTEGPNQYGPDPLAREGTSSDGGAHRASA